jgi:hypothetical protein
MIEEQITLAKNYSIRTTSKTVYQLGFWAAVLSFVFGMGFTIAAVAQLFGIPREPWQMVTLMTPSLFLAFSFVVLMVCIYIYAPQDRKVWGLAGVAFAVIYAALNATVYFVELTVVLPRILNGEAQTVALLSFTPFDSPMYAVDVFGYGIMAFSTLLIVPVFSRGKLERSIRWALFANGTLGSLIPLQMIFPVFLYLGGYPWSITFPLSTILLAVLFKRMVAIKA